MEINSHGEGGCGSDFWSGQRGYGSDFLAGKGAYGVALCEQSLGGGRYSLGLIPIVGMCPGSGNSIFRGSLGSHTLRERHALASHGARERGGLTSHSSRGRGCRGLNVTGTKYLRFLILFTAKNNSMLNHVASAGTPIANLWFRTPTPHPLDHRANRTICTTGSARTHGPHRRNCKTITCERQMECN